MGACEPIERVSPALLRASSNALTVGGTSLNCGDFSDWGHGILQSPPDRTERVTWGHEPPVPSSVGTEGWVLVSSRTRRTNAPGCVRRGRCHDTQDPLAPVPYRGSWDRWTLG